MLHGIRYVIKVTARDYERHGEDICITEDMPKNRTQPDGVDWPEFGANHVMGVTIAGVEYH
jgi:hypothetical protein